MEDQFKISDNLARRIKAFHATLKPEMQGIFVDLLIDHSEESVRFAVNQMDKRYRESTKVMQSNLATLLR